MKLVIGESHPYTFHCMAGLASTHLTQKRFGDAEDLFKQCLALQKVRFGLNHPETQNTIYNLSAVYMMQGQAAEAKALKSNP